MCRIAGIICTEESREKEEWWPDDLAQVLFPKMRRGGPHAFGWMTWDGQNVEVEKHDGDINQNLDRVHINNEARWMVLHTRWATHGATENDHNNHPIVHGDIAGVHNGILINHEDILAETGREFDDASVDSEAIFAAVNEWGHTKGLRKIDGDMVAVYTRLSAPQNIWIAKSYGRDLWLARTKAGSLVFASELVILRAAFGSTLRDVRQLKMQQLIQVVNGEIKRESRWCPPPEPTRPTHHQRRGDKPFDGVHGITDYKETLKAEKAAKEAARAKRKESPEGLFYHQGVLLTRPQLETVLADETRETRETELPLDSMLCSVCLEPFDPGEYRHGTGTNAHWTVTT